LSAGCGGGDNENMLVRALVSASRVEVSVHQSTDTCFQTGEFRQRAGCQTDSWKFVPINTCVSHSCVRHIRVESNGSVLQDVDDGPIAVFDFPEPTDGNLRLVIDTCRGTTTLDLPAPSAGDAPTFSQATGGVRVDSNRQSAGMFATDATLISVAQGYIAWCEAAGVTLTLPVSDQYPDYWVTAFAHDDPVLVDRPGLHAELFPATYVAGPLVENVDLGSAWALTVSAAKASSMYAPCSDYCTSSDNACGIASSDVTNCATSCTLEGGLFPNCNQQYRALLLCLGNAPDCGGQSSGAMASVCPDETAAYDQCAQ
jgi:hypothetical protein